MVLISTFIDLHLYEIDWNEISKISGISFYTINKKKQFQCNKIKYATIKRKNAHNLRYKINQIDLPLIVCTSDYPPTKQTFFLRRGLFVSSALHYLNVVDVSIPDARSRG